MTHHRPRHRSANQGTILYGTTVGSSALNFLRGQLSHFQSLGWDVHIASNPDAEFKRAVLREGVTGHGLPMSREISVLADVRSLVGWLKLLHQVRPETVNIGTPKAGLLGLFAAWSFRTPIRIYTVRGLRYQTEHGIKRRLLLNMERAAMYFATHAVAVSSSVRAEMIQDGIAIRPITVIGLGSSNGVDTSPHPSPHMREDIGLNPSSFVIGFVGRLTAAKGIDVLAEALQLASGHIPNLTLLAIGATEDTEAQRQLEESGITVSITGWVDDPLAYYNAIDVLALPTLREGFPNVVLEAAIAHTPSITTQATGAVDSVIPDETGIIVPIGDPKALANALVKLSQDPVLRTDLGNNAYQWVTEHFQRKRVWAGLAALYENRAHSDNDTHFPPGNRHVQYAK
ncbi:glycosyltransferase family 4 protein [Janibacter sp. FSL W8-0316]|uniref:glycosyltransferase family 4 protein n=1 Tax=Janibacter sp. FSL W8-0316 TaxID=2975325 RepID=UPI0030F662D7